uniref:Uncharacterized protein n=1 Tax=Arundo donax TaxID=35708 RepID=A0A0A9GJX0_ARUDO
MGLPDWNSAAKVERGSCNIYKILVTDISNEYRKQTRKHENKAHQHS